MHLYRGGGGRRAEEKSSGGGILARAAEGNKHGKTRQSTKGEMVGRGKTGGRQKKGTDQLLGSQASSEEKNLMWKK